MNNFYGVDVLWLISIIPTVLGMSLCLYGSFSVKVCTKGIARASYLHLLSLTWANFIYLDAVYSLWDKPPLITIEYFILAVTAIFIGVVRKETGKYYKIKENNKDSEDVAEPQPDFQ